MKKKRKMIELYGWVSQNELIPTTKWGKISALEWLIREVERITDNGTNKRKATIEKSKTGYCRLMVDDISSSRGLGMPQDQSLS